MDTLYTKDYAIFTVMGKMYTMHSVVFFEGEYVLYAALRSIFWGWTLFILCTTYYFRGVDTIYIMHYVVFSAGGYILYQGLRNIHADG